MWRSFLILFAIGYLPGALMFRLPVAGRDVRAGLPAEERAYWAVAISVVLSTVVALLLAWGGLYTIGRLVAIDVAIGAALAVGARGNLRLGRAAPRPGWTAAIPAALVALGAAMSFSVPPSEYIVGGRDPGVYMNEGIQIAQRRSLVTADPLVRAVAPEARDLFFPPYNEPGYYSLRFMGFFLTDPAAGSVVGQFPHGYPIWIAIGYGVDGLSGARRTASWWALFGILAVYFAAAQLVGRGPAAAAAGLLAVHLIQTWHARYPNSEIMTQALLFAGVHAHARAHAEKDGFFGPIAASLLGLATFVRFPAILAAAAAVVAALTSAAPARIRWTFTVTLGAWMAIGAWYYSTLLAPYFGRPIAYVQLLSPLQRTLLVAAGLAVGVLMIAASSARVAVPLRKALPRVMALALPAAAAYAYWLRQPTTTLAPHDAYALRTFSSFYFTPAALALAVAGYAIVAWRSFWKSPALMLVTATFAAFFFYKLRIFPEHFWTTRRYLDVILPAGLLFAAAGALLPLSHLSSRRWASDPRVRMARAAVGIAIVAALAREYLWAAEPVRTHIEYAQVIPQLEQLAARFGDNDLVLIESRAASDLHTLALPLSYVYARNVLVLYSPRPDKRSFARFLAAARRNYRNVYFIGAGGTDLLSPGIRADVAGSERFEVPEYEATAYDTYPRTTRLKPFDFTVYRFSDDPAPASATFQIDVGGADDLQLVRFHGKERTSGGTVTYRWTQDRSFLSIPVVNPADSRLILRMSNGGRPAEAGPARVAVFVGGREVGSCEPDNEFRDYGFPIPADIVETTGDSPGTTEVRLESTTWIPREVVGSTDDRRLGVMIDRAEIQ